MTRDRRGFTLVELIVVTVLGGLVLLAGLQVMITNQRTYNAQSATVQGQQSTRMALEVLFNELREASPGGGDIIAMASDSVRLRLMRKFAAVCEVDVSGSNPELIVLPISREFVDNDSVLVYADNNPNREDDDVWIEVQVTDVDTTETCSAPELALANATELRFDSQSGPFTADSVRIGAPVRGHRVFTFGVTTMGGQPYLGRREGTGTMIPIAGPLRASTGLEFTYLDALGAVTTTPSDVRQIMVTVRTGSDVLNSLGEMVSDSITAWVYTRN